MIFTRKTIPFFFFIKNQLHKILEQILPKKEYEGSDIADKIHNQL